MVFFAECVVPIQAVEWQEFFSANKRYQLHALQKGLKGVIMFGTINQGSVILSYCRSLDGGHTEETRLNQAMFVCKREETEKGELYVNKKEKEELAL